MSEAQDRLISFASVHQAIKAETLLARAGLAVTPLPTPREISVSCGQCLLFAAKDQNQVLAILELHGVVWSKLFSRELRVYELLCEYGRKL